MKFILSLFLVLLYNLASAQTQEQNDSVVTAICKTINLGKKPADSASVEYAIKKHMLPYLVTFPEKQQEKIMENIAFRLQRNCPAFVEFTTTLSPQKGDWQIISKKPKSKLTPNACDSFFTHRNYKYLEAEGDTVNLTLENGLWTDHFKDGTYSKLKLVRLPGCEFEIEFVESNNSMRSNFSKKGDKYQYQVVEKIGRKYIMTAKIPETGQMASFIIYY